jgi:hypothetical protein
MGKHKQKSKRKNPKRRAAEAKHTVLPNGDQMWFDESSSIPEDFKPEIKLGPGVIIFTSEPQWIRDTVQSYFKRAEHGL